MRILVIGAGVIGVTTAWYLAADGHDVLVVERRGDVAEETSRANGGQISVSHAEPWASPGTPAKILGWLGKEDSPLLWRLRADPQQWQWGWEFLRQCARARSEANMAALVRLGLYSRGQLSDLREQLGVDYAQQLRGILHLYDRQDNFAHACRQAEAMTRHGCERVPLTPGQCRDLEPALSGSRVPICGGTYTRSDESGDAWAFTRALASHAHASGVRFRFHTSIAAIEVKGERLASVRLSNGDTHDPDAVVVAAGSYTRNLLADVGVRLPIIPAKGYSVSFQLSEDAGPRVSLTDDAHRLVFSRLGDRLRVAGTAEFCGFDNEINAIRCAAIARRAEQWFPYLAACPRPEPWCGLRPATPGNVPIIGATRIHNLWVNSGHGTLGWTLACGSARLLSDLMANRPTSVDPTPYALALR